MTFATLRGKLTVWLTAVVLAALCLYSAAVYVSLRQVLWHELDERLHNDIESLEGLLQPFWSASGPMIPVQTTPLDADDFRWMQVWSPEGRLLFSTPVANDQPIEALVARPSERALSLPAKGDTIRVKEEAGHIAGHPVIVRAVASEARLHQEMAEFLWLMALAMPIVAVVAGFGGYQLVRRTLRPVDRLVSGANAITADRLDVQLPVANAHDEVGQIAVAFNATLRKLNASFDQMRRFTANASHELRTPLAALRATGEAALTSGERREDFQEAVADMLEDAEQLGRLLDTMMLLTQADAGTLMVARAPVDLDALVADVAKQCEVLAVERNQRLLVACDAGTAHVDATILRIAVANVVHNAIRHSSPGTDIAVRASVLADAWIVEVQDHGPGIPREHHERLFERFYRVDPGRSRAVGGVGLGLAMARWSVESHGGRIEVISDVGMGSTFRILLPRDG